MNESERELLEQLVAEQKKTNQLLIALATSVSEELVISDSPQVENQSRPLDTVLQAPIS